MDTTEPTIPFIRARERVLFIGDSITDALRKPAEANVAFRLGNGYAMMAAAHLMAARPADDLRFKNRGISGDCLGDLQKRWQADCLDLTPTVISILIGVNDSGHYINQKDGASPKDWINQYRALLKQTRAELPETRFVLCEPFALVYGDITSARRSDLGERQSLLWQLAKDFAAVYVSFQSTLDDAAEQAPPEYWLYDGVHPTAAGHWILAGSWLQAVGELGEH